MALAMSLVTGQGTPGRQDFRMLVELTLVMFIALLVISLVTGQGTPGRQDFRSLLELTLVLFVVLLVIVTGQGIPGRQDFRRLVDVEALGLGRMGRRGQIGLRERTGTERMLMKARADPPPQEPDNPIPATAAKMAGLPEGAAIARRQLSRREATAPIDSSRRGTIRAVSRREPVNSMQREVERADAVASYVGAGLVETKERKARATRMTRQPACRLRSPGASEAGADGRKATARRVRAAFRPSARLRVPGRGGPAAAADRPSLAGPRTECVPAAPQQTGAETAAETGV